MSTRFTPQGLVHEHSDDCSHSLDGDVEFERMIADLEVIPDLSYWNGRKEGRAEVDDTVRDIFNAFEKRQRYRDPGDLTIEIQDDMPLVTITADGRGVIGAGHTLSGALQAALETARNCHVIP